MQARQHEQYTQPRQETNTVWYNPLDQVQRVRVNISSGQGNEPRPTEYVFQPKSETLVPSRYDSAIQVVHCAEDSCRNRAPGYCVDRTHEGNVVGGLAPQLQRKGQVAKLLPALDPNAAELDMVRAQLAAANIARKNSEDAQLLAEARRQELEAELAKKNEAALDAATKPDQKSAKK